MIWNSSSIYILPPKADTWQTRNSSGTLLCRPNSICNLWLDHLNLANASRCLNFLTTCKYFPVLIEIYTNCIILVYHSHSPVRPRLENIHHSSEFLPATGYLSTGEKIKFVQYLTHLYIYVTQWQTPTFSQCCNIWCFCVYLRIVVAKSILHILIFWTIFISTNSSCISKH